VNDHNRECSRFSELLAARFFESYEASNIVRDTLIIAGALQDLKKLINLKTHGIRDPFRHSLSAPRDEQP
jgi:hypothetical protein